jgi:hypothetical protein
LQLDTNENKFVVVKQNKTFPIYNVINEISRFRDVTLPLIPTDDNNLHQMIVQN